MESIACYGTYLAQRADKWTEAFCLCCRKSFEDLEINDNCWEDENTFICLKCKEENMEETDVKYIED